VSLVRLFRAGDEAGVVATVREVYDEYGFTWEADGYHADLYDPGANYDGFWVAETEGLIVGCAGIAFFGALPGAVGTVTLVDGVPRVAGADCELCRLYVRPSARGAGVGSALAAKVAEAAAGRRAMEIWSDKRFKAAHRLYGRLGARVVGERVCPGDPDRSLEWGLVLPLQQKA
jgi:GNAT superfamily N-acetyltransferase